MLKKIAVAIATAFAALGPPLLLTISVSVIAGYGQDDGFALAFEYVRAAAAMGVWWVCAIVAVVNCGSSETAPHLLWAAAASTIFCAAAALTSAFGDEDIFSAYATCLILSLPILALAILNAQLAKRRAALGRRR